MNIIAYVFISQVIYEIINKMKFFHLPTNDILNNFNDKLNCY